MIKLVTYLVSLLSSIFFSRFQRVVKAEPDQYEYKKMAGPFKLAQFVSENLLTLTAVEPARESEFPRAVFLP